MNDKVYRDLSTKENREWWAAVERAAKDAPELVAAKPLKGDERFIWRPEKERTVESMSKKKR